MNEIGLTFTSKYFSTLIYTKILKWDEELDINLDDSRYSYLLTLVNSLIHLFSLIHFLIIGSSTTILIISDQICLLKAT